MLISVILSRQTPDDAKVFGEIYCEKDDVTLGRERESRVGICLKTIYNFSLNTNAPTTKIFPDINRK